LIVDMFPAGTVRRGGGVGEGHVRQGKQKGEAGEGGAGGGG